MAPKHPARNPLERDECFVLVPETISIDEKSILRLQGYRDIERVRLVIQRAAQSAARTAEDIVRPRIYYRFFKIRRCEGQLLSLENGSVFENEAFQRFLPCAEHIAVFILTMGHDLDRAVIDCIEEDQLLNALFLESAGWLGIEAATRRLSVDLRRYASDAGCKLSPRLGPGYSYKLDGRSVFWPLEQQRTLFGLFADDAIDVQLLESCAMLPKISRSGIYGFLSLP